MSTAIANPTDPMASFYEKLAARLRGDVAELIPEDVLKGMVNRVVEEEFFKDRAIPNPKWTHYNNEPKTIATHSQFTKLVVDAAKPLIEQLVRESVETHRSLIEQNVNALLEANQLSFMVSIAVSNQVTAIAETFVAQLKTDLQRIRGY